MFFTKNGEKITKENDTTTRLIVTITDDQRQYFPAFPVIQKTDNIKLTNSSFTGL